MQSLPSATYTELDQSTVLPASLADFHGLVTPTLFGPSDKPYLVTNVDGFKATFGANGVANPFYAQIKRALARGTALYIQRLVATGAVAASIALDTSEVTINAKWVGAYANGNLSVQYAPVSAGPAFCKLIVNYGPNSLLNETWTAPSLAALVALVNAQSALITITEGGSPVEPANTIGAPVFLAAGTDGAFVSSSTRAAAVNALLPNFNSLNNLATVGALGAYTPADAANLLAYVNQRGDIMALFELDPSLSPTAAIAAALALALPIGSSFIAVYWGSFVNAWSSEDNAVVQGSVLTDVMSVFSYSDSVAGNSYRAPAGATRGLIPNVESFAFNMLSPAESTNSNALVQAGVNIVGDHKSFGPIVWGAQTMNQKNSALDAINVRRMLFWLRDQFQPIFDSELFEPMDPMSWLNAYNQAKVILQSLIAQRALSSWQYTGDQNASTIASASYNKPVDLANGLYKALINLVPTGYISGIEFTVEVNNLLSLFNANVSQ